MSKLASMPFFPADFFADTEHVSPEVAKAYLFLLGHAWIRGAKLPNDDRALARMARVSLRSWVRIRGDVLTFWSVDSDGKLINPRLSHEYAFVCRKVELKRKQGALGGKAHRHKKSNENNENGKANVDFRYDTRARDYTHTHTDSESVFKDRESTEPPAAAEVVDLDVLLFREGKRILGQNAGGQIAKLRDAAGGVGPALEAIRTASRKENPREYISKIIHNKRAELKPKWEGIL